MHSSPFRSFLLFFLLVLALPGLAQEFPEKPVPARFVNDFTGTLSGQEQAMLESKLKGYMDSTSNQLVIVVVKNTGDYPPGDYAFEVGRRWGIGQKGKNNGLVLLWATETRKIYIATGYGLEGAIPDAVAKRIVSDVIVPAFKQQEWYRGLDEATTEIIQRASGEYKNEGSDVSDGEAIFALIAFGLIGLVIFFLLSRTLGRGCRNTGGGGMPWFGPYTTMSSWGSSSGGGWSSGGGGGGWDFGGGSFGGGGAGGDY